MQRREFIAAMAATSAATTAEAAGQTPAPAPGKPLTVTLLGTGTPAPSLTRQSSGYLIEVGNDLIVWDHGPGAHQRLIESGRRSIETTHAYRAACGNHRDNAIIAKRAGVKTLVLTHLLGQIDRPGIREQIVHEIQDVFEGKVIWGEDLMRLDLTGSRVANIETRQE